MMEVDGGRVMIKSKPFIASELGEVEAPPPMRGLKVSTAGGRSNVLRGFILPNHLAPVAIGALALLMLIFISRTA